MERMVKRFGHDAMMAVTPEAHQRLLEACEGAMLYATPFQYMMGHACLAIEALEQAAIAKAKIDAGETSPHMRGKLLNLDFFVATFLPEVIARSKSIQTGDESCMDDVLFA